MPHDVLWRSFRLLALLALAGVPASGQTFIDCGDLWSAGFPERWHGGLLPCYEIDAGASSSHARLFADETLEEPTAAQQSLVDWARQAVQQARSVYSRYLDVPDVVVVFTNRPLGSGTSSPVRDYRRHPRAGEPCPLIVNGRASVTDAAQYRQSVARSYFHCAQFNRWGELSPWWDEGTADYFSNLAFASANLEHRWSSGYRWAASLFDQGRAASLFFQAAGNDPSWGPEEIVRVGDRLTKTSPPQRALEVSPNAQEVFHRFTQRLYTQAIMDSDGSPVPTESDEWPKSSTLNIHPDGMDVAASNCRGCLQTGVDLESITIATGAFEPSAVGIGITLPARYVIRLALTGLEGRATYSKEATSGALHTWYELPDRLEIDLCEDADEFQYLAIAASSTSSSSGEVRLTLELEEATPCSCPSPLRPPSGCAIGTWDFDMGNMSRLVRSMAGAFSRSVPGVAGSSSSDFRVQRVEGSMTVERDGRFRNTMWFEAESAFRRPGGVTGTMIFNRYERGQEGQICIDPETNRWHFLDQTTTETMDGKLILESASAGRSEQPIQRSAPIVDSEDAILDGQCTDRELRLTGPYLDGEKVSLGIEWSATRRAPPP